MAWEAISKAEVAALSGVAESKIHDIWYSIAIDLIYRFTGISNIGTSVSVTEVLDGNGMSRIRVTHPPIESITSVVIDTYTLGSSYYTFDSGYIIIKDNTSALNPYIQATRFTRGNKNIQVTYISGGGSGAIDYRVSLAVAIIVKELSNLVSLQGAESQIASYRPGQSAATELPLIQWGLHGKIKGIITTLFGPKARMS